MKTTLATSQNPFIRERERDLSLEKQKKRETRGVSSHHTVTLPFTLKSILMQKKKL
jgi:hypothetical protein